MKFCIKLLTLFFSPTKKSTEKKWKLCLDVGENCIDQAMKQMIYQCQEGVIMINFETMSW